MNLGCLAGDEPVADGVSDERVPKPDLGAVGGCEQSMGVELPQSG